MNKSSTQEVCLGLLALPLLAVTVAAAGGERDKQMTETAVNIGGKRQHDANLVTLHRVKDFRELVPEEF